MKRKRIWMSLLSVLLIIAVYSTTIYGEEPYGDQEDKTLAPYFVIENGDPAVDSFPLKATKVSTNIGGVIAETFVTQTYVNEGANPINANYVFPASTRVAVHGMKMTIGDKVVTATIKEKEEAKQDFEEAKSEGKSASLLEQERANVFNMNVANIMPGDTVLIELHYTEMVESTEGISQFIFPTVVGPRYSSPSEDQEADSNQWIASPYLPAGSETAGTYDISVRLEAGVPVTYLDCKTHKVDVEWEGDSAANIILSDPQDFAGNRDYVLEYKLTGPEVQCGLMMNEGEDENFFLLTVQPPERFKTEDIPPREYIFVLDVSGSMFGYPLDTAKNLIKDLVSNLRQTDHFNVILFSGASFQMSPTSVPASPVNVEYALDLIDQQEGGGGTELVPALESALSIPMAPDVSRSIITITDGYISSEKEIFNIITQNLGNANFFSFGIGDSVNRYLIEGIAKAGMGESFVVMDSTEAQDTAERFRTYIESPILTDIKVTYDGFDAYDVEPANLPTLFAQRPIVLYGKWRGDATGTITITGKTGRRNYVKEISVSEIQPQEAGSALRYLWARKRVERLTDYGFTKDNEATRQEITELGLKYSMMTPYTSFIAVIDTIRNTAGNSTDVNQPLPLPLNVSDLAVGGSYISGSEPGDILLICLTLFMLSIIAVCRISRKKIASMKALKAVN